MKRGFKKRGALLLSALFTLTLVFGAAGNTKAATNATADTYGNAQNESTVVPNVPEKKSGQEISISYVGPADRMPVATFGKAAINVSNLNWDEFEKKLIEEAPKVADIDGTKCTGFTFESGTVYTDNTSTSYDKDTSTLHQLFDELKKDTANNAMATLYADYNGKQVVYIDYRFPAANRAFYNSDAYGQYTLINKSDDLSTAVKQKTYAPAQMDKNLKVDSWVTDSAEKDDPYGYDMNGEYRVVNAYAKTSNYLVVYDILDPSAETWNEDKDTFKSQIYSAGSTITLPKQIDGRNVKWISRKAINGSEGYNDIYTVEQNGIYSINSNMMFTAVWDNGNPAEISEAEQKNYVNSSVIKSSEKELEQFHKEHGYSQQLYVTMGAASVAPNIILDAVKNKDIDVVLDYGAYTWTINGKDVTDASKKVNLEVLEKKVIPSEAVTALAGNLPTKQISLSYSGDFGFKATLNYKVGSEYSGKNANLFWYKPDGIFAAISNGKVDKNGYANLTFTHASNYVIVLSDQQMGQKDAAAANEKIITTKTAANAKTGAVRSPKTGQF